MRVVVVNHNGGADLARCVAALAAQRFAEFEAVIVDNGSRDGSIEALAGLDGRFRVLALGANLGFAAASNRGAEGAVAPWLATLNPDAFAEPGWLEALMAAAARHPEVAMFGSTQISARDPGRFDGTGDAYFFAGFPWRGNHGRAIFDLPAEAETFAPCGAAALWRRDAFARAGGFDERFFCYCEDVDLAFRLRLAGERCVQVGAARVHHVGSAASGVRSPFTVYHGARNRIWTLAKNMPPPLFALAVPAHAFALAYLALRMLARRGGLIELAAMWRGVRDALRGLAPVLAERRRIQAGRRAVWRAVARALCWSPVRYLRRAADLRRL